MPITFKSKHAPDILMLESVALQLIKMMGHSGTVPGSIDAEGITGALAQLEQALSRAASPSPVDDDEAEPSISLDKRAGPLTEMLKAAAAADDYIIWDR